VSRGYNADYNAIVRTSSTIAVHSPPAVREIAGEFTDNVPCPLCRTPVALLASVGRVEGRCTSCTVVVRLVDGVAKACGWMGGGDMRRAGAAIRFISSPLEVVLDEPGDRCGDAVGTTAGYYRHRTHQQKPCQFCIAAYRIYNRTNRGMRAQEKRDALRPCGTEAAYARHLRAGEEPCDACRLARAAVESTRARARRKARKAKAA
jgi:hypothetical protein